MKTYGYVIASPCEHNVDSQAAAMVSAGVQDDMIVAEKQTVKALERPLFERLAGQLNAGDTLVVNSLGSLGANNAEIIETWRVLTQEKKAVVVALDIPMLDTPEKARLLTDTAAASLLLQVFSYIARSESENKKLNQTKGIKAARGRGVKFGRPRSPIPSGYEAVKERYIKKELSSRSAAEKLGVSQNTFLLWFSSGRKQ